ncbi:MAG: hypothetical protein IPG45_19595 [Deltaproteobacteria bacterium]|jgi:hypothetical protein|nr:hypothetical protein [Deltaproteobacteria bacterium]
MWSLAFMLLVAAPKVETATTATTTWSRPVPMVAFFPTEALERSLGEATPIAKERIVAFAQELADAAIATYQWRRWEVAPGVAVARALAEQGEDCNRPRCRGQVAYGLGASEWIESTLEELADPDPARNLKRGGRCRVVGRRYQLPANRVIAELSRDVEPCTSDNLLAAAIDLGQDLAEGPRAPVRVSLNLTPLEVPSLDIPDIVSLRRIKTATAARTRSGFEIDRALQIYKAQHVFTFRAEGQRWVARNGQLLTECDLRLVASEPMADEIREHCFGNDWEWAWLGAPAGGLVALGSYSGFQDGDLMGVVGFTIGMGTAITSAVLAVLMNQDARQPNEHVYFSSWRELEAIVEKANRDLRQSLELTEAEVELAGLRR